MIRAAGTDLADVTDFVTGKLIRKTVTTQPTPGSAEVIQQQISDNFEPAQRVIERRHSVRPFGRQLTEGAK
jgi:hypothetical protein